MAEIYREGISVVSSGEKSGDGSECQPIVNIIFIHGLRGHPRETWEASIAHTQSDDGRKAIKSHRVQSIFRTKMKHRQLPQEEASTHSHGTESEPRSRQTIFWIEDFLPQDIPNARILTYGYNADVIGGLFLGNNKNSISNHGQDLRARLERELVNKAPIIFVAHSLGGIIAKEAFCWSEIIRQRTKLIVFLGTPHRGSPSADWGQIASNMVRLALQDSNKKILETLEVDYKILDNNQEAFKTIASKDGLIVHSFQEARGILGMKGFFNKVVDDFSSRVDLPSTQETVTTIDANHMEMTKFSSKDDSGYQDILIVLKRWTKLAQQLNSAEVLLPSVDKSYSLTPVTSTVKVHFMVPLQRNGNLIGRRWCIESLESMFRNLGRFPRIALVGHGGVGKTRIALEYASQYKNSDSVSVFWIYGSTAERIEKAYQEIAKEAGLEDAENLRVDQLWLVKNWLESKDSGQWLMVIDSADDENLLFGEDENQRHRYIPWCSHGSILLTTRNRRIALKIATAGGTLIRVPEMSVSESKSLLAEKLGEDNYDKNDLTELAEVLENVPLALVLAAAFIGQNSQSIAEYLQMYRGSNSSKINFLSQKFEYVERYPDTKDPVAVTWAISFEHIREKNRRAADLLSLMSVLDRQAIPKSILSSVMEKVELEAALGTLKAFSLITVEKNCQAFDLHPLVHLATRNWLKMNKELSFWTGNALVLLSELFPSPMYENREIWMAYLPHARTVLDSGWLPDSEDMAQSTLCYNVSWALKEKRDYRTAEMMARKSLLLRRRLPGGENLETLHSLSTLGVILWNQGRNEEAEEFSQRALNGYKNMLGKHHFSTLMSLNNLGLVLRNQGRYEEAEILHRRALNGCEKVLGKEHLETMKSVDYLTSVLRKQGQVREAEELHRKAMSDIPDRLLIDNLPDLPQRDQSEDTALLSQGAPAASRSENSESGSSESNIDPFSRLDEIISKNDNEQAATSPEDDEIMSDKSSDPDDTLDEFIINPRRYQDRLAELLKNATQNSSLFTLAKGKSSIRDVEAALNDFTADFSSNSRPQDKRVGIGLKRCRSVLQQACENIDRMKTCEFCTGFISVLVICYDRYDVVHLNRLDTEVVQDLFDLSCKFPEVGSRTLVDVDQHESELSDLVQKIKNCEEKIWKALGLKDSSFWNPTQTTSDWNSKLFAMANLVDLMVLLYCSAHLERFDQKYLQMSLEGLRMNFTLGAGEIDCIVFKRRSLACLDNYLGNQQVWVLQLEKRTGYDTYSEMVDSKKSSALPSDQSIREKNTQLSVSAHIQDLADIWGPLWPVKIEGLAGIVAFQAGIGVLVPWPKDTDTNENGELYYHWTENIGELSVRLMGYTSPTFHEQQRLLIGEDDLKVKPSCCFSARKVTQRLKDAHCLRMQGTERPRIYRDSETISGTMGYIATLTGAITLKRSTGVTVKDCMVSNWMPGNWNRNPKILECWYGVEVSACNGNARRRRLKDIFNLPEMRKHLDLCYPDWTTTDHGNVFSKALADQDKRAFRRLWKDNLDWQSELQKLVYSCFDALRHTGTDRNNQLSVFWISHSDQQALVDIPAGLSSWTGILKVTECSCAMAVLSTNCHDLIPSCSRFLRVSDCRTERSNGFTLIETALVINKDAHSPKRLSYTKNCECGSKRCWGTHKLKKGDNLSMGQLGKIVVLKSSNDHAQILARWEQGVGTERRRAGEVVIANILKGSPMPHHWEVMDSDDERRGHRPVQLFLISHALKKHGEWKSG